jgi:2-oxo-4-hydroxy-4-carboxy-5-ureidoimidazoline decarboxylase
MTIDQLNSLDRESFVAALGWVFEDSPWVAERAWPARPFAGVEALHAAMVCQLSQAESEEQLALLRAHPDLGTRARISRASTGEQKGAGLDDLTPHEFERLQGLNSAYRAKDDILRALEKRLEASPEEEQEEALRQVHRIARFRLLDSVQEGNI